MPPNGGSLAMARESFRMRFRIVLGMCLWPVLGLAGAPLPGLTRYETAEVSTAPARTGLVLDVATAQGKLQVELWPHSLRAPGFQLLVREGGALRRVQPAEPRTYQGRIPGEPGSEVRATWGPDGLHAVLRGPGGTRFVEPLTEFGQSGPGHVLYRAEDLAPVQGLCGVHGSHPLTAPAAGAQAAPRGVRAPAVLELAVDTDVEYFRLNGSNVEATMHDIEMVINSVEAEYVRDVDISIQITAILVATAEPDPYSSTDPRVLLQSQLTPEWQSQRHTGIRRDAVQLFTGKDIDNNVIGIAWIGTVCGSLGQGLSQSRFTSRLPSRTDLTAHELGHNWSAQHCDTLFAGCCSEPSYTMCSGIRPNVRNAFGAPDQATIEGFRDQISSFCLGPPPSTPTPSTLPALGEGGPMLGSLVLLSAALVLARWAPGRRRAPARAK